MSGPPTVQNHKLKRENKEKDTNGSLDALDPRVRDTQDFISHVNGHRTNWTTLIFASLLAVLAIAFFVSFILCKTGAILPEGVESAGSIHEQAHQGKDMAAERAAKLLEPSGSEAEAAPEPRAAGVRLDSKPAGAQIFINGKSKGFTPLMIDSLPAGSYELVMQKKGYVPVKHKLVCKADEAAQFRATMKMTPRYAALESAADGDDHMQAGDFESAQAAYERALSFDSELPGVPEKLAQAREELLKKDLQELFDTVKTATENENKEKLLSMLDESDPAFYAKQKADAEKLFRSFNNIHVAFSDIRINGRNQDEVRLKMHVRVEGYLVLTGRFMVVSDSDKDVILRRQAQTEWKLCAMD